MLPPVGCHNIRDRAYNRYVIMELNDINEYVKRNGSALHGEELKAKWESLNLPKGWLECPNIGTVLKRMIPSKTPLSSTRYDFIPKEKQFTPIDAIKSIKKLGFELKIVIDLTNTDRYYDKLEFEKEDIRYEKIRCKGYNNVPEIIDVNRFSWIVIKFYEEYHARKNTVIMVHCTHGYNRTGYMMIHAMMRRYELLTLEYIVNKFSKVRSPGIYKQEYINYLFKYYHEIQPENLKTINIPHWKKDDDLDDDNDMMIVDSDMMILDNVNDTVVNEFYGNKCVCIV